MFVWGFPTIHFWSKLGFQVDTYPALMTRSRQDIITPFALAAHSEGLSFRGGKLDDTTVVVGLVTWTSSFGFVWQCFARLTG
jgi:hypothetical protein